MRARLQRSILQLEAQLFRPRPGGGPLLVRLCVALCLLGALSQGFAWSDRVVEERLEPARLQATSPGGRVVQVNLPGSFGDTTSQTRERLWLSEDGVELGPAHASHRELLQGRGAFRHWRDQLYFSASDGSPPGSNGRTYTLRYLEARPNPLFLLCAAAAFLLWAEPLRRGLLSLERASPGPILFGLAALTVGLRLWWGLEPSDDYSRVGLMPYSDARLWQELSELVARTGRIPADHLWSARRPLTYWIHGSWMALVGVSTLAVFWLNAICSGLSTALIFDALRRLAPAPVALCAALAHACSYLDAGYGTTTLSEPSGYFLSNVSLWLLALAIVAERQGEAPKWLYFWGGVALAASNLARPLTLLVGPALPLAVLLVLSGRGLRRWQIAAGAARAGACLALGGLLLMGPWIARQKLEHDLLTLSDNTAEMLFAASDPRYGTWTTAAGREATLAGHTTYAARNTYYNRRLKENLAQHPGHYAKVIVHTAGATLVGLLSGPAWLVLGLCLLALWSTGPRRAGGEFFLFSGAALALALAWALGPEPPRVWAWALLALGARDLMSFVALALGATVFAMGVVATPYPRFSYSLEWLAVALQVWGAWQLGRWARRGGSLEDDLEGLRATRRLPPVAGERAARQWIGRALAALFLSWALGLGIALSRRGSEPEGEVPPLSDPASWVSSAKASPQASDYAAISSGLAVRRFRIRARQVAALGPGEDVFHAEWAFQREDFARSYFLPEPPASPAPAGLRLGFSHFPNPLAAEGEFEGVVTALGCWSTVAGPERRGEAASLFEVVAYTLDERPAGATWIWADPLARQAHARNLVRLQRRGDLHFGEKQ